MYGIAVDASSGTIEVMLAGTMSSAEVDDHMTDEGRVLVDRRFASVYGIVIDLTGRTVRTHDLIRSMGGRTAPMPQARAIAVVATSQQVRPRIGRLFGQDHARIVATIAEGSASVVDGVEPVAGSSTASAVAASA